jgi:hypothetical protein
MPHLSAPSRLFVRLFLRLSFARPLLLAGALLCGAAVQAAPTGLLNDTGQTQCANASDALVACDSATTGNAGTRPRQDGRFGRDVASPTKVGGGAAGFDFTPLDASGNPIALTGSPAVPAATPRCVKDNVTNLIWEVKTTSGLQNTANTYTWYNSNNGGNAGTANGGTCSGGSGCDTEKYVADINALNLCGFGTTGWRLPTRRELLSIVHNGLTDNSTAMIDVNYFPATVAGWYWTSDTYAPDPSYAWVVNFNGGSADATYKTFSYYVRLVRSGQ